MSKQSDLEAPTHPRTWLTWCGFGLWWLLVCVLPFTLQQWLGKKLGRFAGIVAKKRAYIARTNIALCFPEKTPAEREALFWESMEAIGIGFFEFGMAWFGQLDRLKGRYTVEGLEYLEQAQKEGHGVLVIGLHHITLEIGGALALTKYGLDCMYQPHKNPVYEYIMRRGREKYHPTATCFARNDIRGMVKALRKGRAIFYLSDQDLGPDRTEFAPFFNIPTATVTATSSIIKAGRAKAIHYVTGRNADGTYYVRFSPTDKPFGENDIVTEASMINEFVEREVRKNPGQYLWAHKRFKTRPKGEPSFYSKL